MIQSKLASNNGGCSPMSSSCVIWQGPDLPCISLCRGDSIDDVTYKLASEVCEIKNELDLSDLDLKCLVTACMTCPQPEKKLGTVLALIIDKICSLVGDDTPVEEESNMIRVAACFQEVDSNGDPVTELDRDDYIKRIGNKVCQLITDLTELDRVVDDHEGRIQVLEAKEDPQLVLPTVEPNCIFPDGLPRAIDVVLDELEKQFCDLRGATGKPTDLAKATIAQCVGLESQESLSGKGTMSAIPGWKAPLTNLSDSFNNLWLTVCDIRAAVKDLIEKSKPTCDDIAVGFTVTLEGKGSTLAARIIFAGPTVIPPVFTDCPGGSKLTIKDTAGNVYTTTMNVASEKTSPMGVLISLGTTALNVLSDFTFTLEACLSDGSSQCSKMVVKNVTNSDVCPQIQITKNANTISYQFDNAGGAGTEYTVALYGPDGVTLIGSKTHTNPGAQVSGSFTGLTHNTSYRLSVTTKIGSGSPVACPDMSIKTDEIVCTAPTNVTATLS